MPVSRVSCRYPGPLESVHIKLLVYISGKLCTQCTCIHGLSSLRKVCAPCDLPFPKIRLYRVRRTDGQTDRRPYGRTELSTTLTLAAHAREG